MNTLDKISDKHSSGSIDRLILDENLRIRTLITDKELNILLILFNTGNLIKDRLSDYPKLKNATEEELNDWRLIKGGIGIRWESIDEDLSAKGFIKKVSLNQTLRSFKSHGDDEIVLA